MGSRWISSSTCPTSRCWGRGNGCVGVALAGPRVAVRRRRLPLRPAAAASGRDAVARGDRARQTVGKTAAAGHVARVFSRDRRVVVVAMGRGGPANRSCSRRLRRSTTCFRSPVPDGTPPPTTSKPRRLRAFPRSAAGGPAVGSRALRSNGTCSRAHRSRRSSTPSCSSSTAAARLCRRSKRMHGSSSRTEATIRAPASMPIGCSSPTSSSTPVAPISMRSARFRRAGRRGRASPASFPPLAGRRTAVFTTGPAPTDGLDAEIVHVSRNLARRERCMRSRARRRRLYSSSSRLRRSTSWQRRRSRAARKSS